MKTFNVTVNGTAYSVTVEETAGGAPVAAPAPAAAAPAAPAPAAPAAAPAPAPKAAPAAAGAITVTAPMPGNILDGRHFTQSISISDIVFVFDN